jgi:glycosyltransferase involved in cell wall biosynthesis
MVQSMRIGIVPCLSGFGGGLYQYSLTMLEALDTLQQDRAIDDEFIAFCLDRNEAPLSQFNKEGWEIVPLKLPLTFRRRILQTLGHALRQSKARQIARRFQIARRLCLRLASKYLFPDPDKVIPRPDLAQFFTKQRVDWMLFPAPKTIAFETGIPYVMAVHDLQHRLQPEFPEVSADGQWESREYLFRNGTRYATLILVDSEVGKEDVLEFYGPYGLTPDRVEVLPFLPACYLDTDVSESEMKRVRTTYHLPERYLFYPAQFWPHKNHIRIVQALGLLKERHCYKISAVFCGSYGLETLKNTFHEVMSLAHQLQVENQIHYLGYVAEEDMSGLYAGAVALVMPTFFGPTNIPVLEGWAFRCPVLTSDIRGIREQVEDAAVLVDPRSVEAIAHGIYRLWTDEDLRRTLAGRGQQRLATYTPDDYRQRLMEIFEEAKARVRSEKPRSAHR